MSWQAILREPGHIWRRGKRTNPPPHELIYFPWWRGSRWHLPVGLNLFCEVTGENSHNTGDKQDHVQEDPFCRKSICDRSTPSTDMLHANPIADIIALEIDFQHPFHRISRVRCQSDRLPHGGKYCPASVSGTIWRLLGHFRAWLESISMAKIARQHAADKRVVENVHYAYFTVVHVPTASAPAHLRAASLKPTACPPNAE